LLLLVLVPHLLPASCGRNHALIMPRHVPPAKLSRRCWLLLLLLAEAHAEREMSRPGLIQRAHAR
jgi:hypothetical protein